MGTAIKLTPGAPNVAIFNSAAILNEIVNQATGKTQLVRLQQVILHQLPLQH